MATQDTNVAGVTFYDTDFKSIKRSSKVALKPNPHNKYDHNAIEVWIDGSLVGHIKREINQALLKHIYNGEEVTAKVKKVVGGGKGKNYGIIISVTTPSHINFGENLGEYLGPPGKHLLVYRANAQICLSNEQDISWEKFLEDKKGLPGKLQKPPEPDYHKEYMKTSGFFERLFNNQETAFTSKMMADWRTECSRIEHHNLQRERSIKSFNKANFASEFERYNDECKLNYLSIKHNITFSSASENAAAQKKGYLTFYENILYERLKNKFLCFQQVSIKNAKYDILALSKQKKCLWVIEVDGIIHRFQSIYDKDKNNQSFLLNSGFSLIRISNFEIKRNLNNVVDKVSRELSMIHR